METPTPQVTGQDWNYGIIAMEKLFELATAWREEAIRLRDRYADERGARILAVVADELTDALNDIDSELLNLEQAAAESGYSADHLGRLIRQGKIPNAGRKNAPKIRRGDLPRKRVLRQRPLMQMLGESRTERIARAIVSGER